MQVKLPLDDHKGKYSWTYTTPLIQLILWKKNGIIPPTPVWTKETINSPSPTNTAQPGTIGEASPNPRG